MIYIKDLLNKIKWDKRENPDDYKIYFLDKKDFIELKYKNIKRLEGNFMIIEREDEEVNIPIHRIRYVKKKGILIWKR